MEYLKYISSTKMCQKSIASFHPHKQITKYAILDFWLFTRNSARKGITKFLIRIAFHYFVWQLKTFSTGNHSEQFNNICWYDTSGRMFLTGFDLSWCRCMCVYSKSLRNFNYATFLLFLEFSVFFLLYSKISFFSNYYVTLRTHAWNANQTCIRNKILRLDFRIFNETLFCLKTFFGFLKSFFCNSKVWEFFQ